MNADGIEQVEQAAATAGLLRLALQVLSVRALVLIQMVLNAVAFGVALASESPMRLAVASVFAIANWCVVHVKPPRQGENHGS